MKTQFLYNGCVQVDKIPNLPISALCNVSIIPRYNSTQSVLFLPLPLLFLFLYLIWQIIKSQNQVELWNEQACLCPLCLCKGQVASCVNVDDRDLALNWRENKKKELQIQKREAKTTTEKVWTSTRHRLSASELTMATVRQRLLTTVLPFCKKIRFRVKVNLIPVD